MKKGFYMLALMCIALFSKAVAQKFTYGGGLVVGSQLDPTEGYDKTMAMGLNAHGGLVLPLKFRVLANFNYYFPLSPSTYDMTALQTAVDVHYMFLGADNFGLYALAGINGSYMLIDPTDNYHYVNREMYLGFDLGAGVDFSIFFTELKYDTGFDQFQVTAGLRF